MRPDYPLGRIGGSLVQERAVAESRSFTRPQTSVNSMTARAVPASARKIGALCEPE
jgi:hypothetical protein